MHVTLCSEKSDRVSINVIAELIDNELLISGQDLGEACTVMIGNDEYEYFYSFDEENTRKLLNALKPEAEILELLDLLNTNFNGNLGCNNLRNFCVEKDIKYSFHWC